ncbi:hypothetical protein OJ997_15070 [Solirubrobacter phytolaccae]|uniref:Uncharacterized protein n=1 Tax=Solirubrobacter phytolaccae TaxID=1404360 RepID=A0A9X3SBN6_9ACTN|nr:hypothetical protein [Solirubrobacter phytolaccae]MDA0181625.1 hypothetical protein [Solirubrobacter phytolaccae]
MGSFNRFAVVLCATAVLGGVGAGTAYADEYDHVDLVLEAFCDGNGDVSEGEFLLEEHGVGPLADQDQVFTFDGVDDTDLGFEVEWDDGCDQVPVDVTLTGASGSGGSFSAGSVFSATAPSTLGATGPLTLSAANGYHLDPGAWTVSGGQTFDLSFTFSATGGVPVVSTLPLHVAG